MRDDEDDPGERAQLLDANAQGGARPCAAGCGGHERFAARPIPLALQSARRFAARAGGRNSAGAWHCVAHRHLHGVVGRVSSRASSMERVRPPAPRARRATAPRAALICCVAAACARSRLARSGAHCRYAGTGVGALIYCVAALIGGALGGVAGAAPSRVTRSSSPRRSGRASCCAAAATRSTSARSSTPRCARARAAAAAAAAWCFPSHLAPRRRAPDTCSARTTRSGSRGSASRRSSRRPSSACSSRCRRASSTSARARRASRSRRARSWCSGTARSPSAWMVVRPAVRRALVLTFFCGQGTSLALVAAHGASVANFAPEHRGRANGLCQASQTLASCVRRAHVRARARRPAASRTRPSARPSAASRARSRGAARSRSRRVDDAAAHVAAAHARARRPTPPPARRRRPRRPRAREHASSARARVRRVRARARALVGPPDGLHAHGAATRRRPSTSWPSSRSPRSARACASGTSSPRRSSGSRGRRARAPVARARAGCGALLCPPGARACSTSEFWALALVLATLVGGDATVKNSLPYLLNAGAAVGGVARPWRSYTDRATGDYYFCRTIGCLVAGFLADRAPPAKRAAGERSDALDAAGAAAADVAARPPRERSRLARARARARAASCSRRAASRWAWARRCSSSPTSRPRRPRRAACARTASSRLRRGARVASSSASGSSPPARAAGARSRRRSSPTCSAPSRRARRRGRRRRGRAAPLRRRRGGRRRGRRGRGATADGLPPARVAWGRTYGPLMLCGPVVGHLLFFNALTVGQVEANDGGAKLWLQGAPGCYRTTLDRRGAARARARVPAHARSGVARSRDLRVTPRGPLSPRVRARATRPARRRGDRDDDRPRERGHAARRRRRAGPRRLAERRGGVGGAARHTPLSGHRPTNRVRCPD